MGASGDLVQFAGGVYMGSPRGSPANCRLRLNWPAGRFEGRGFAYPVGGLVLVVLAFQGRRFCRSLAKTAIWMYSATLGDSAMTTEMTTAQQVADYILRSAHASGSFVSNLKLQKLLYYVQAWHLAVFERPLFSERFQAWVHGPVIPEVYRRFNHYRWRNIDEEVAPPDLSPGTIAFVEEVLEEYGPLDARRLEYLTHREAPWIEARGDLPPDQPCEAEISEQAMQRFYRLRLSDEEVESIRKEEPVPVPATECPETATTDG